MRKRREVVRFTPPEDDNGQIYPACVGLFLEKLEFNWLTGQAKEDVYLRFIKDLKAKKCLGQRGTYHYVKKEAEVLLTPKEKRLLEGLAETPMFIASASLVELKRSVDAFYLSMGEMLAEDGVLQVKEGRVSSSNVLIKPALASGFTGAMAFLGSLFFSQFDVPEFTGIEVVTVVSLPILAFSGTLGVCSLYAWSKHSYTVRNYHILKKGRLLKTAFDQYDKVCEAVSEGAQYFNLAPAALPGARDHQTYSWFRRLVHKPSE